MSHDGSIAPPGALLRAALSFASLSKDSDPPSVSTTRAAPIAAAAKPTAPVPLPSSSTDAPSRPSEFAFASIHRVRTALELHTFPPVP
jgi:hypothetical protein